MPVVPDSLEANIFTIMMSLMCTSGRRTDLVIMMCFRCMTCPALSDLDLDTRARINQAYMETPDRRARMLKKHRGEKWVQLLRAELIGGPASQGAEPEDDLFCHLCHKTGHRWGTPTSLCTELALLSAYKMVHLLV